jgi:hypothetical protein
MLLIVLRRVLIPIGILAGLVALAGCGSGADADEPDAAASIQSRWWEWAASEPSATNPVADATGAFCLVNQPDDIWFFAGTFGGEVRRECTVPSDRPIVVPLVNLVCYSEEECDQFMLGASGTAELDGQSITPDRIEAEPITYNAVFANPITYDEGRYDAIACGLWVRIEPLTVGRHELIIHGQAADFTVDVEYAFEVIESNQ